MMVLRVLPELFLLATLLCVWGPDPASGMIEGLYCGKENCYDVLGVTRETPKNEIGKAYRSLARKYHPDKHRTTEAKAEAELKFQLLATAYEILKDDGSKADYDYMLDNPEEFYEHYYRYYRRRLAPQVDVRLVIAVTLFIISAVQYYTSWYRYDMAIKYLATVPKYRIQATEIARKEGIPLGSKDKKKKEKRNLSREEVKREEDEAIRKIIEEKMDIRGGYAKPTWKEILIVQLVILPYTVGNWIHFQAKWLWKFTIMGQPLGDAEKLHLIRKYMGKSVADFDAMDESEHDEYLRDELHIWDNFKAWKEEVEEEERRRLAESARYKSYRRYMKNHGPGRITFDDD